LRIFVLHILIAFCSAFSFSQNSKRILDSQWQFRQKGTGKWYSASVPGTVHTDLFENKLIPDPFYSDNEKKLQWIENEGWEYKTEFICDTKTFLNRHIELQFEALDTYAKVYLNNVLVLTADNMFRSWSIDVKKEIKEGKNNLSVVFESAVKKGKEQAAKLNYVLPGEEKVFTRKSQFQYGWDFGPRFVSCGIGRKVKLFTWNDIKIISVNCITKTITDSTALVDVILKTNCDVAGDYKFERSFSAGNKLTDRFLKKNIVTLKRGLNSDTIHFVIQKPKLWWCNGMGKPFLYDCRISLFKNNFICESKTVTAGIRTIKLVQEKDSLGASFYFKLNGIPVFMKGANYIPQNIFLPRVNKNHHKQIISMAKNSNMNMLRVWSGGIYEEDEFYSQCDENGILVWQDLMFACAMYPGDSAFLNNVKHEIKDQALRIGNHPCIALWCGNNEIDEGWHNWGWQKQFKYSPADSLKIWNDYKKLFHEIIPQSLREESIEADYWPSSPSLGWGRQESLLRGDSHYWGIWWGNEPFENYSKKVGRFMSEYGFQSLPVLKTLKSFCDSTNLNLNSTAIKNHQKHPTGYQTINTYMEKDYKIPADLENYIYVSQLLQADGMKTAIEAHRGAKPYCMGTLFWQFNDCWPGTTWSSIDFQKNPKAFYYSLKKLYANILLSVAEKDSVFEFHINSDSLNSVSGEIIISIKDFSGKVLLERKTKAYIKANSSQKIFELEKFWLKAFNLNSCYMNFEFKTSRARFKSLHYFVKPKDLNLPETKITWSRDKNILKIKCNSFTKNLFISIDDASVTLSDNFFDLEAGEQKEVKILSPVKDFKSLKFISLNNISQK